MRDAAQSTAPSSFTSTMSAASKSPSSDARPSARQPAEAQVAGSTARDGTPSSGYEHVGERARARRDLRRWATSGGPERHPLTATP
jgi:hypothetical protein